MRLKACINRPLFLTIARWMKRKKKRIFHFHTWTPSLIPIYPILWLCSSELNNHQKNRRRRRAHLQALEFIFFFFVEFAHVEYILLFEQLVMALMWYVHGYRISQVKIGSKKTSFSHSSEKLYLGA